MNGCHDSAFSHLFLKLLNTELQRTLVILGAEAFGLLQLAWRGWCGRNPPAIACLEFQEGRFQKSFGSMLSDAFPLQAILGSGPTLKVLPTILAILAFLNRRHTVCITVNGYLVVIAVCRFGFIVRIRFR
jgi:hypothetical protein